MLILLLVTLFYFEKLNGILHQHYRDMLKNIFTLQFDNYPVKDLTGDVAHNCTHTFVYQF